MNVSELMVRFLQRAGVDHVFGYPGDPSVEFLEACRREDMAFVLARREGTAGLMAEGAAMVTGRPGVVLTTLGPGSTNLVNATANATLDRVPMIALSGQIDTVRRPTFTHQVVDQHALFTPVTKWATTITAETAGHVMRKAHRVAVAPRPGAVHISTPADVVGAEAIDDAIRLAPTETSMAAMALDVDTSELRRRIEAARRPLVLVGLGAMRADAGAETTALAEHVGAAMVTSPMAKGTLDEGHDLFAGTLDMACNEVMWDLVRSADLVLAIGFDAVELIKPWRVDAPVIHIDDTPNTDQIYAADAEVVGPIAPTLDALRGELKPCAGWSAAELADHRTRLAAAFESGRVTGQINPSDVVRLAAEAISADAIVTTDVGSHKLLVGQGWRPSATRRLLMTNGLSSMGFSLPASIAAKLVRPDHEVVCFTGDGGLAMVQGELAVASALGLAIRVVVFVDRSLNRIELKQQVRGYEPVGTVIDAVDAAAIAEAMGCHGIRASNEAELEDALAVTPEDRPLVIAAQVDPSQYAAQF